MDDDGERGSLAATSVPRPVVPTAAADTEHGPKPARALVAATESTVVETAAVACGGAGAGPRAAAVVPATPKAAPATTSRSVQRKSRNPGGQCRNVFRETPGTLPTRIACIGAGWTVGERHLPSLQLDERVEVVGIVDPHPERAAALARRFAVPNHATGLDAPWLAEVEAATVGVPPLAHAEVVEELLGRGIHVLCEKPLAFPAARAAALVEQAEAAGLVLAVVQNFQFSEAGRRLFELVDHGALGTPTATYGFQLSNPARRLPHWAPGLPGGLFLDETAHLLYLSRRVLGSLSLASVDAHVEGREIRHLTARLAHEHIWSVLELNFTASLSEWQFVVVGDEATAAFDVFRDILVVLKNDGGHRGREVLRTSGAMLGEHLAGVVASGTRLLRRRLLYGNDEVVRRFVDAVRGDPSRLEGLEGARGVEVAACLQDVLDRTGIPY